MRLVEILSEELRSQPQMPNPDPFWGSIECSLRARLPGPVERMGLGV